LPRFHLGAECSGLGYPRQVFAWLIGNHFEAGAKLAGSDAKTEMLSMVVRKHDAINRDEHTC